MNNIFRNKRPDVFDADTPFRAPEFILPGLRAGQVGLLCAPGGTGKSFLALELAFAVAAGNCLLEKIPIYAAGPVLVIQFEDDSWDTTNRGNSILRAMREQGKILPEMSELSVFSLPEEALPLLDYSGTLIEGNIAALSEVCEGMRLVVLDPLSHQHVANENDSTHMNMLSKIFKKIAQKCQCGIILCHHTNKAATLSGQGDIQQAARGSSALVDAARLVLNLSKHPRQEGWLQLSWSKLNGHAPIPPIDLVRGKEGVLEGPYGERDNSRGRIG